MNAKDFIMKALTYWFENQLSTERSLEETISTIKVCVLLDVAQLFLGYDDDEIHDICCDFIDKIHRYDC